MPTRCRTILQACAVRVARINAAGVITPGANNMYVSGDPVEIRFSLEVEPGADLTQKTACDQVNASYRGRDRVKRVNLGLKIADLEHQLIELITGAALITIAGEHVGHLAPEIDAAEHPGVTFEWWTKAWDGDAQDSQYPWFHWGIGRAVFSKADETFGNDFVSPGFTGFGYSNVAFGNGPANDWPVGLAHRPYGVFQSNDLPTDSCGYITTPADSGTS